MPLHLASEAWSNSEMAFSYVNDVIIVMQTAWSGQGAKKVSFTECHSGKL